jgi:hypothetical protein
MRRATIGPLLRHPGALEKATHALEKRTQALEKGTNAFEKEMPTSLGQRSSAR